MLEAFDQISIVKGILDEEDMEEARNERNKPGDGRWKSVRDN